MPTIAVREPEQLSLFDLLESSGDSTESAQPHIVISIPDAPAPAAPIPAANAVVTAPKKAAAARKPTAKERITSITKEPACAAFLRTLDAAVQNNDFRSLLDVLGTGAFHLNRQETIYNRFSRNSQPCAWRCTAPDRLSFSGIDYEQRDDAVTFPAKKVDYNPEDDTRIHEIEINFAYVSLETAEMLVMPVVTRISVTESPAGYRNAVVESITPGKAVLPQKFIKDLFFIQMEGELHQIVLNKRPWIKDWLLEHPGFSLRRYLAAPWLETLSKAGFNAVADRFLNPFQFIDEKSVDQFNRLCGPGTKPKDIFKCSKTVYTVLKEEKNLEVWDTIRRLDKKDQITGDSILIVYQMNLKPKELDTLNSILGIRHNDKPVFTVATLVNYLNRLDMYEAISTREALPLLNDYLHMCRTLNMPPRIDGDSLKREHDIAARLIREQRNRIAEEKMRARKEKEQREIEEGNSKLARAEYHENIYFIRPITEYNDLLDEAIQQDNCVASYADRIAAGQSRIFTMRETAHPERSLVTIELSPDCKTIRQKYLAHNQQIRNKSMTEFIERWHRQLNAA